MLTGRRHVSDAQIAAPRNGQRSLAVNDIGAAGAYRLGDRKVKRLGYGAMQLAGPGVFGPPKNRELAIAVLRIAVAHGVNHIDTSDFYGPHITNELIAEALWPYAPDLTIVTKVGARRSADGAWLSAITPKDLADAVRDNLRNLRTDVLDVVNLRVMKTEHAPSEGSIEKPFTALAEMQRQGLIRHLGISNATASQVREARLIAEVVTVQNHYNLIHRADDPLVDELAADGIAYVPFFPLGGFSPLQSSALSRLAAKVQATPMQVALAWLLRRAPNILLIPGTASPAHLHENLASAEVVLPQDVVSALDNIGRAKAGV
jgi:pyridoxine 4-dehydrogenase